MNMRTISTLFVLCLGAASCGGSSASPATDSNAVQSSSSTTSAPQDLYSVPTDLMMSAEFSSGDTAFRVKYGLGRKFTVSDPGSEIDPNCSLDRLPKPGTTYQYIYAVVEVPGSRRFELPVIDLGAVWEDGSSTRFTSLDQLGIDNGVGIQDSKYLCIPNDFLNLKVSKEAGVFIAGRLEGDDSGAPRIKSGYYFDYATEYDLRWAAQIVVTNDKSQVTNPRPAIFVSTEAVTAPILAAQGRMSLDEYKQLGQVIYFDQPFVPEAVTERPAYLDQDLCAKFYSNGTSERAMCEVTAAGPAGGNVVDVESLIQKCIAVVATKDERRCTKSNLVD